MSIRLKFKNFEEDFPLEITQIIYWCKIIENFQHLLNKEQKNIIENYNSNINYINYISNQLKILKKNIQKYNKEPSNLFNLFTYYLNIIELINKNDFSYENESKKLLEENYPKIISKLEEFKFKLIDDSLRVMKNSIYKKELFKQYLKECFEEVLTNIFQSIVSLYQFYFIFFKNLFDKKSNEKNILTKKKFMNSIFSTNAIVINDYNEKKFAENNKIYFDSIYLNENEKDFNTKNILKLTANYYYYIENILKCMKIRKSLFKNFINFLYENFNNKYFQEIQKVFNKIINNNNNNNNFKKIFNIFNQYCEQKKEVKIKAKNYLNDIIIDFFKNIMENINNEIINFENKWKKLSIKLKEDRSKYKHLYNNNNNNENNNDLINLENEINNFINNDCKNFIINYIKPLRERQTSQYKIFSNYFENFDTFIISNCNELIDLSSNEINNIINIDIFDNIIFLFNNFFKNFPIKEDKEVYIEKIKYNLLNKDFSQENLGQSSRDNLSTYLANTSMISGIKSVQFGKNNSFNDLDSQIFGNELNISNNNNNAFYNQNTINTIELNNKSINFYDEENNKKNDENKVILRGAKNKNNNINNNNVSNNKNSSNNQNLIFIDSVSNNNENDSQMKNKLFTQNSINNNNNKIEEINTNNNKNFEINIIDINFELEKNENLINKFSCCYYKDILNNSKGILYLTDKRLIFLSNKKKIFILNDDLISISKNTENKLKNCLEFLIKDDKKFLFFKFYNQNELISTINNITKKNLFKNEDENLNNSNSNINFIENKNKILNQNSLNENEENKNNDNSLLKEINNNSKLKNKLLNRSIQIKKILKKINFFSKIKSLTKIRLEEINNEITEKEINFLPENKFEYTIINENLNINAPLTLIFHFIFNPNTICENFEYKKSFFENIFLLRGDNPINLNYNQEQKKQIPKFFDDLDYVNNLFNEINETDLNNFLNEIKNWGKKISFKLNFVHPIQKFIGPDNITMEEIATVYFISPTDLIVDYHSYGDQFPFSDFWISIIQYKFHSDIIFNKNEGKFQFKTNIKILHTLILKKNCFFEVNLKNEAYTTNKDEIIFHIYEPLKKLLNIQNKIYCEKSQKLFENNVKNNLNKFSDVLEEDNIEDEIEEEEDENKLKNNNKIYNNNNKDKQNENNNIYFQSILIFFLLIFKVLFIGSNDDFFSINNILNLLLIAGIIFLFYQIQNKENNNNDNN